MTREPTKSAYFNYEHKNDKIHANKKITTKIAHFQQLVSKKNIYGRRPQHLNIGGTCTTSITS